MLIMAPQKLKMPSNPFPAGDNTQYIEDVQRLRVSQLKLQPCVTSTGASVVTR